MEKTTETTPSYPISDPQATDRGVGGNWQAKETTAASTTNNTLCQSSAEPILSRPISIQTFRSGLQLISGGATRIFPSLFSIHLTNDSLPLPEPQTQGSDFAEKGKGMKREIKDDGLSETEKLMEGKTFSKDEINRLIEIINSRAFDVPEVDQEKKDLFQSARGAKDPIVAHNMTRPTEEKQNDSNKAVWELATPLPKPTTPNETQLKLQKHTWQSRHHK